jgi:hypothetical protein
MKQMLRYVQLKNPRQKQWRDFYNWNKWFDTNFAFLEIYWENSRVVLKFEVPSQKNAIASIEKVLAGPATERFFSSSVLLSI